MVVKVWVPQHLVRDQESQGHQGGVQGGRKALVGRQDCNQKPEAGQVQNTSGAQDPDPRGRCGTAKVAGWLARRPGPFVYKAVVAQSVALEAQSLRVWKPKPSRVTSGLGVRLDPCNPFSAPPPEVPVSP